LDVGLLFANHFEMGTTNNQGQNYRQHCENAASQIQGQSSPTSQSDGAYPPIGRMHMIVALTLERQGQQQVCGQRLGQSLHFLAHHQN